MLRARFTKQCKLARERNSETSLMCLEISTGDLLTTCKLKNTSHLHFDQISIIANKQSQCSSGAGDRHRCKRDMLFGVLNNGAKTSNLMSAKVNKSGCLIHLFIHLNTKCCV